MIDPHVTIEPSILYPGTPVVLISTQNEDGTANRAPMSSAWWLGWPVPRSCLLASQRSRRRATACPTWIELAVKSSLSAEDRCQ